ncbi:MAG: serine/threonine protein kinase [Actinomycetota bacterium]|nr:serine/threonine protein kinase [Actinomycetota bacterium]
MTSEQTLVAGRYRLGARIGSGAMGVVWQAHDERLHRTVAVKQLLSQPGLSADQANEARQRAMREGRIAARLAHPNAITVYDVAEHNDEPWLIMEYLPSKSLAGVLQEQETLAPEETARIGSQIAAALVAAHAAGIVHRDVKPANVLIADDGVVKITDFGISRATGDITVTATGMLAGTPAYLAPEVAKGEPPTAAADVFSLGSTLYTAVEGHSPFGLSENTLALLYAVAAGKVTPPRQAGTLTALLMQLLRADPNERPTMSQAKEALAAVAVGKPPPSIALANQRTDMYPKPQQQRPPHSGTRLDVHPFAEPTTSGSGPTMRPDHQQSQPRPRQSPPPPPQHQQQQQQQQRASASPPAKQDKRDKRSIMLTVLAIVAAVLVGILVASLLNNDDKTPQAGNETSTTQQPAPTTAAPTTTTAAQPTTTTTTAAPTTTTTPPKPAAPTPADYENAIAAYYKVTPGDPRAGWELLTETARQQSRSFESYQGFWSRIASVDVLSAKAEGNKVRAQLRYHVKKDGKKSTESQEFVLVERDGKLLIDSFKLVDQGQGGRNDDDGDGE